MELIEAYLKQQPSKPKRPLLRDIDVPDGFERRINGMIVPVRPTFQVRYEGQKPDETMEECEKRMNREAKIVNALVITLLSVAGLAIIATIIIKGLNL